MGWEKSHLWQKVDDHADGCPTYHGVENCSGEYAVILPKHDAIILSSWENPDGYMLRPRGAKEMPTLMWVDDVDVEDAELDHVLDRLQTKHELDTDESEYQAEYRNEVLPNYMTW